jgi:hypothetical protein
MGLVSSRTNISLASATGEAGRPVDDRERIEDLSEL